MITRYSGVYSYCCCDSADAACESLIRRAAAIGFRCRFCRLVTVSDVCSSCGVDVAVYFLPTYHHLYTVLGDRHYTEL